MNTVELHPRTKDITGRRFGKLVVLYIDENRSSGGDVKWFCKCDCGNIKSVLSFHLKNGHTKSCGCLQKENPGASASKTGNSLINQAIKDYKISAKKRGHIFDLNDDECIALFQQPCAYCGTPPKRTRTSKYNFSTFTYNGIDRVDNSVGYINSNCVPCCQQCNISKMDRSVEDFKSWVKQTYENMFKGDNERS